MALNGINLFSGVGFGTQAVNGAGSQQGANKASAKQAANADTKFASYRHAEVSGNLYNPSPAAGVGGRLDVGSGVYS